MMETTAATAANDDNAPTLFNEDALVMVVLLLGGLLLGIPSPASGVPPDPTDDGVCTWSSNG